MADEASYTFIVALAVALVAIAVGIMVFFGKYFTLYEKTWFLGIMILSAIISIVAPEEGLNGVSGIWIMALYLADTFLNILCELLISKQSKWNFIVSVFVEIVEILCCIVLAYRFATMTVTLFFWLPCDIASFINWNKKKDTDDEELTKVRTLKGWQEILLIAGIVVWTIVVGWFLSGLDVATDLFGGDELLATIVCYLDACASAVGIVNGLAILFRFREQWIAWYICSVLEMIINIMAGQWVLLPLKLGYLTNTTYGYIKWSKYIKEHPGVMEEKTFF
jgi:nicotinamide mononucleotide transporter